METRGAIPVIAVIILIVLGLVSAVIVAKVTIPLVRDVNAQCAEALKKMSFDDIGFSCSTTNTQGNRLHGFTVRNSDPNVQGIQIGLRGEGKGDNYKLVQGSNYGFLCMLDSRFGESLSVPPAGGVRTYVAKGNFDQVSIAPILASGVSCFKDAKKQQRLNVNCADPAVIARLQICDGAQCNNNYKCDIGEPDSCADCQNRVCGNGVREGTEQCDASDFGVPTQTCESVLGSGWAGNLGCNNNCTINTDDCRYTQPSTCTLLNANWSVTETREGTIVNLTVGGNNCDGNSVSLRIFEDDLVFDDPALINPPDAMFANSEATATWTAEWQSDGLNGRDNPPEYYFEANLSSGQSITSPRNENDELKVYTCGDGLVQSSYEQCDDGNRQNGDGCSATCRIENGYQCTGQPSQCTTDPLCINNGVCNIGEPDSCPDCQNRVCGNGVREGTEQCDDGNRQNGDGCSATCIIESGWSCSEDPQGLSGCSENCGNGIVQVDIGEECENVNGQIIGPSGRNLQCSDFSIPPNFPYAPRSYNGGALACESCRINTVSCTYCGDGWVDPVHENCEPPGYRETCDNGAIRVCDYTTCHWPTCREITGGGLPNNVEV